MFDVSLLFIQCNTNSCCEHVVAGFNIYLCVFQSNDPCLCCVWGELVVVDVISDQGTRKTACPLCENLKELDSIMHNFSKARSLITNKIIGELTRQGREGYKVELGGNKYWWSS